MKKTRVNDIVFGVGEEMPRNPTHETYVFIGRLVEAMSPINYHSWLVDFGRFCSLKKLPFSQLFGIENLF